MVGDNSVLGIAVQIIGAVLTVLSLSSLPESVRAWQRWIGPLGGSARRWVANILGIGLFVLGYALGVSAAVSFSLLLSAVFLAACMDLLLRYMGLPNWVSACRWDEKEGQILVQIRSTDGSELANVSCTVQIPRSRERFPNTGPRYTPPERPDSYHAVEFPRSFPGAPQVNVPPGRYRMVWKAKRGLGEVLVRRTSFRLKDGVPDCPSIAVPID